MLHGGPHYILKVFLRISLVELAFRAFRTIRKNHYGNFFKTIFAPLVFSPRLIPVFL
jgi:hypothetical protein